MRKTLEFQAFLEYSMVVIHRLNAPIPVPCTSCLQYSKIVPNFFAGGLMSWSGFYVLISHFQITELLDLFLLFFGLVGCF